MRSRFEVLGLLLALAACTSAPPAPRHSASGSPAVADLSPSPTRSGAPPVVLDVVADESGPEALDAGPYLDGMRLAVAVLNRAGGLGGRPFELTFIDSRGDQRRATDLILNALGDRPSAILYVGPGQALAPLRPQFTEAGTPVVLLEGDLYTSRQLFPQAFQTTIPWEWQAKVIARYLVVDRGATRIAFVGAGPEARPALDATRSFLKYWGGHLSSSATTAALGDTEPAVEAARQADGVVIFGSPLDTLRMRVAIESRVHPLPRLAGFSPMLMPKVGEPGPLPGTTACYTYTWAGWAQPIRRVGAFIRSFEAMFGHPPVGFEQEGYDAVRALALGLERSKGRGRASLVHALETIKDTSFSSFPIDLGPDDHLFLPRDELGLFAVPGPREKLDPWQSRAQGQLWRPVMRTFTYDGERDDITDADRPVFFPGWQKNQPGPEYWKSRYGIVSRPKDPLH